MGIEEIKNTALHEIIPRIFLFTLPGWRPILQTKKSEANKHINKGKGLKPSKNLLLPETASENYIKPI